MQWPEALVVCVGLLMIVLMTVGPELLAALAAQGCS